MSSAFGPPKTGALVRQRTVHAAPLYARQLSPRSGRSDRNVEFGPHDQALGYVAPGFEAVAGRTSGLGTSCGVQPRRKRIASGGADGSNQDLGHRDQRGTLDSARSYKERHLGCIPSGRSPTGVQQFGSDNQNLGQYSKPRWRVTARRSRTDRENRILPGWESYTCR